MTVAVLQNEFTRKTSLKIYYLSLLQSSAYKEYLSITLYYGGLV